MVEFRFDIKPLFQQSIIKISSNLLPHTFRAADRRQVLDATSKISEIIDRLGQLSAVSQKLSKPVTTAQRLRMSENQVIYLMADVDAGHNGAVLGLLKVGTKDLYLFDESGQTKKVESAPCILDFYIHESRQRAGLGKVLFETMLTEENWQPVKCSVDRPSEKLLAFLRKHYGLINTIPQANNFVLYVGFFDEQNGVDGAGSQHTNGMHVTNSPNTQLFGAHFGDESVRRVRQPERANSAMQVTQISPVGRYGARRPLCSMAEKTKSEVSLTPSQMAELEKQNARKSPLDALSRTVIRPQGFERRSGLQDVDESYLKKNVFTKPLFSRNSGLGEAYAGNSNAAPAAGAQMANIRQTGGGGYVDVAQGSVAQANMYTQQQSQQPPQMQAQVQMGQQQNAPVQIQQAHNIPAAGAASGHGHAHRQQMHHQQHVQQQHAQQQHAHQQHAQAQQAQYQQQQHQQQAQLAQQQQAQYQQQQQQAQLAQQQQQAQYQQQQQQQQPQYQQQQPAQYQQQQAQHAQNAQQVQQQVPPQQQQQYQQQAPPAATQPGTNSVPPTPEPEMCTTCPNCQTTIYLVRGNDTNYDGSLPPIIHNTPAKRDGNEEPGSSTNLIDVIKDVTDSIQNLQTATEEEQSRATIVEAFIETPVQQNTFNETETASEIISTIVEEKLEDPIIIQTISATKNPTPSVTGSDPKHDLRKSTTAFQLSKQHTGMKNISSGVGMAVTPTNKMEFDQETREDFGIVKINRPIGKITSPNPDNIDAISTVSSTGEGLTEQGYYDLKFYHNKLW